MKLSDFVEINPRTTLAKGTFAEFVPMEAINPSRRYVHTHPKKICSGGTKFVSGDTLFARITPCLENGKIAQFVSTSEQPAFGSTEYWIFRAKKGISDPAYVYYLAKSDLLRKPAEKSMVGASGRQRAQIEAVQNIDIGDTSIEDQYQVASILSAYDDLIENNSKRIEKLESIARLLYRDCFEGAKFESKPLCEVADINPESVSRSNQPESITYIDISGVGSGSIENRQTLDYSNAPSRARRIVKDGDLIWATVRPNRKQYAYIHRPPKNTIVSTGFAVLRPVKLPASYLYYFLSDDRSVSYLVNHATGSAYPAVNASVFDNMPIPVPPGDVLQKYDKFVSTALKHIQILYQRNEVLAKARDLLLPQLMSGEIKL